VPATRAAGRNGRAHTSRIKAQIALTLALSLGSDARGASVSSDPSNVLNKALPRTFPAMVFDQFQGRAPCGTNA